MVYLFCFGQCDRLVVAGQELNVLAEASLHQGAHSAKDPDIALHEKGGGQSSLISQRE